MRLTDWSVRSRRGPSVCCCSGAASASSRSVAFVAIACLCRLGSVAGRTSTPCPFRIRSAKGRPRASASPPSSAQPLCQRVAFEIVNHIRPPSQVPPRQGERGLRPGPTVRRRLARHEPIVHVGFRPLDREKLALTLAQPLQIGLSPLLGQRTLGGPKFG